MENIEILPDEIQNFDVSPKIVLLGDSGTGKSCLMYKAIGKPFIEI